MKVLVLNSGSSSIKFQVTEMPQNKVVCKGLLERIGQEKSTLSYTSDNHSTELTKQFKNHAEGLQAIIALITDGKQGVIQNPDEIQIIGHRVVHGGDVYDAPALIDNVVIKTIKELASLAPLHNPANAAGIETAIKLFPKAAQVAIFDTAFHQSLPKKAYSYAIPSVLATKNKIRVYGFHGTSHKYVSEKAIAHLKLPASKIITVHLGNGCSITAVKDGKSVEHSMGFGPSNGLIMGTRCGDIDQSVVFHLMDALGYSSKEVNTLLQKESGLSGITGFSDFRDVQEAAENGNTNCMLALEMTVHRIKKFIGAYAAILNGIDALVFTAGIGENSAKLRELVCADMDFLGISLDNEKNSKRDSKHDVQEIQLEDSAVRLLVVPTDEEYEIARQSYSLVTEN